MRLWHEKLISYLPRQQLLGQNRECCALRGKGWGKPHSVVNYVFTHPYYDLYRYHMKIIDEMRNRNYHCDNAWLIPAYRGKIIGYDKSDFVNPIDYKFKKDTVYIEHDNQYLQECLDNLKGKGIYIEIN